MALLTDDILRWTLDINGKPAMKELARLEQSTKELEQTNKALRAERRRLEAQGKKNTAEYRQLSQQISQNNTTLTTNRSRMAQLRQEIGLTGLTTRQLRAEQRRLQQALDNTTPNTPQWRQYRDQLQAVNTQMQRNRESVSGSNRAFGQLRGMLPQIGWAALITGVVAATKRIIDFTKEVFTARRQVQKLTDLSGKELSDLTSEIRATAKTFDKDFNETLVATNNFAKTMGIEFSKANDLIRKGFAAGADESGEFISSLREYGPQFRAAGIDAETAISIMTQSIKDGVFSDKGADAIKEATLSLREMPKTAKDAIDNIGLSSEEIQKQIESGQISVFDAIQMISRRMSELPPQSNEVGQAIADIFKGAGEDAGLDFLLTLGKIDGGMDGIIEKTGEAAEVELKLAKANEELAKVWDDIIGDGSGGFKELTANAKLFLSEGIVKILKSGQELRKWFVDIYNDALPLRAIIEIIRLNFVLLFKTWVIGFKEMKNGLVTIGKALGEALRGNIGSIPDIFKEGFKESKNIIVEEGKDIVDKIAEMWDTVKTGKLKFEIDETSVENVNKIINKKVKVENVEDKSIVDARKKALDRIAQLQRDYELSQKESFDREIGLINDRYDAEIKKAKEAKVAQSDLNKIEVLRNNELNNAKLAQEELFQQQKNEVRKQYGLITLQEQQEAELEALQLQYDLKLLQYEEFEIAKQSIQQKYNDIENEEQQKKNEEEKKAENEKQANRQAAIKGTLQTAIQVQDVLLDAVMSSMNAELDAAGDNEEEKKKIQKKYADKLFAIQASRIVTSTASAAMDSFNAMAAVPFVGPVLGAAAAAAAIAAGVIQLNDAKRERQKVKALAKGQYPYMSVIGREDNKTYTAPYVGNVDGVQYFNSPTLISERGGEMVFDASHTRALMMNKPLLNEVMSLRVPQRQSGNYDPVSTSADNIQVTSERLEQQQEQTNMLLGAILNKEYWSNVEMTKINDTDAELNQIYNDAAGN